MGTPVPLRSREEQCIGADPKVYERQLTEEERRYYDSLGKPKKKAVFIYPEDENLYINQKMESDEMKSMTEMPNREVLAEMCRKYPSRYKAGKEIAKILGCSRGCVENWIKKYGLKDIWKTADQMDFGNGVPDQDTPEFDGVIGNKAESGSDDEKPVQFEYLEDPNDPNELTLGVQPGNGQIHYEEPEPVNEKGEIPKRRHLVTQVLCMHSMNRLINISRAKKEFTVKNISSTEQMTIKFEEFPDFLKDLYEIFKSYV
ncbi:MAG TPA: helix-turn-helix domain-containing protein [Clostridia bacterium]|nr:helix-turn-helix domain-containing protein [Clostridia bacterium]